MPGFGCHSVLKEVGGEEIKPKVALLLLVTVALEAALFEYGFDLRLEFNRAESRGDCEKQEEQKG